MAEYTFDVQKLYLEMLLADAESFARAQNIFTPKSFDRKLQPIAKFIKDYVDEYKIMPEVDMVNAKHDIKLKTAKDLDPSHFNWLLDEFAFKVKLGIYFLREQIVALIKMCFQL